MKLFHVSWNDPETVFHEMPWKKNFTVYPSLNICYQGQKTYRMRYNNKKRDYISYYEKRQITCVIMEKRHIAWCHYEKLTENMCYHGKKADNMCYHKIKTDSMYYHYHGKDTFVVPLFFKTVTRFYMAHVAYCKNEMCFLLRFQTGFVRFMAMKCASKTSYSP